MATVNTLTRRVSEGDLCPSLTRRVSVARQVVWAALFLVVLPAARADDWKYDVLVLKPGVAPEGPRTLKGLFIGYEEAPPRSRFALFIATPMSRRASSRLPLSSRVPGSNRWSRSTPMRGPSWPSGSRR